MIDWWLVFSNALWLVGGALVLAAVSYASWRASASGERLRAVFGRPKIRMTLGLAGTLACLGLAATSRALIEVILWLILALVLAAQVGRDWRALKRR
jgi:hypothetical protein